MHWPLSLPPCPAATLPPWVSWGALVPLRPGLCTGRSCCLEGSLHLSHSSASFSFPLKSHMDQALCYTLPGPWAVPLELASVSSRDDYTSASPLDSRLWTERASALLRRHSGYWLNTLPQGRRRCDHLFFKLWARKLVPSWRLRRLDMGTAVTLYKKMFVCPHACNKGVYLWLYFVLNSIKSTPFYQEL